MLPSINGSSRSNGPDDRNTDVYRLDDRTAIVPQVARPGRVRTLLPWIGFGVVAVAVVAATTAWAAALRGPDGPSLMTVAPSLVTVSSGPASVPTSGAAPTDAPTRAPRQRSAAPARPAVPILPRAVPAPVVPPPATSTTMPAAPTDSATATAGAASLFGADPPASRKRAPASSPTGLNTTPGAIGGGH